MNNWIANEPGVSYGGKDTHLVNSLVDRMRSGEKSTGFLTYDCFNFLRGDVIDKLLFNKYSSLHYRLSKIGELPANWDDEGALAISQVAINSSRTVIDLLEEMSLLEKNIAIHIFPAYSGGIQFEMDGAAMKADIEIAPDGLITLTKYSGKENTVSEYKFDKDNVQQIKRIF